MVTTYINTKKRIKMSSGTISASTSIVRNGSKCGIGMDFPEVVKESFYLIA